MLLNQDEKHELVAFRAHITYELGGEKNKTICAILQGNLMFLDGLLGGSKGRISVEKPTTVYRWVVLMLHRLTVLAKQNTFNYPVYMGELNERQVLCVRVSDLIRFARSDGALRKTVPAPISSHMISRMLKKEGLIQDSEKEMVVGGKRYAHMKVFDYAKLEAFIDEHLDRSIP